MDFSVYFKNLKVILKNYKIFVDQFKKGYSNILKLLKPITIFSLFSNMLFQLNKQTLYFLLNPEFYLNF